MYRFWTWIGGQPYIPPGTRWRHYPHADHLITDTYAVSRQVSDANRHDVQPQDGFHAAVAVTADADADQALTLLHAAQPAWAARPARERIALVAACRRLADQHRDAGQRMLVADGVPCAAAERMYDDMLRALGGGQAVECLDMLTREYTTPGYRVQARRVPVGVAGVHPSASYPLVGTAAAVWALACGNAVMLNCPAAAAPTAAWFAKEILVKGLRQVNAPDDILAVVSMSGHAAWALWRQRTQAVAWQASTPVCRALAAEHDPHQLLLTCDDGGNNPVIVWHDADLAAVADELIAAAWDCGGQLPGGTRWLLPHPNIAADLTDLIVNRMLKVGPGVPSDPTTTLVPLHRPDMYVRHLEQADQLGARALRAGQLMGRHHHPHPRGPFGAAALAWIGWRQAPHCAALREPAAHGLRMVVVADETDPRRLAHGYASLLGTLSDQQRQVTIHTPEPTVAETLLRSLDGSARLVVRDGRPAPPSVAADVLNSPPWPPMAGPWYMFTRYQEVVLPAGRRAAATPPLELTA